MPTTVVYRRKITLTAKLKRRRRKKSATNSNYWPRIEIMFNKSRDVLTVIFSSFFYRFSQVFLSSPSTLSYCCFDSIAFIQIYTWVEMFREWIFTIWALCKSATTTLFCLFCLLSILVVFTMFDYMHTSFK